MEKRYRQLIIKVRAYLRKEQKKKSFWSRFISDKMFCPDYWKWQRRSVSIGAGWGAFFAISPLPMQGLWGAAACAWKKGNIPIAVLAAWLTLPGFTFFSIPMQWYFGSFLLDLTPIGNSGLGFDIIKQSVRETLDSVSLSPLMKITSEVGFWHVTLEFVLGAVLSCSLLGIFCYLMTQGIWRVFSFFAGKRKKTTSPSTSENCQL